jgi:hypothetical protein
MLKSISWQEFLTVISVITVIYYAVLGIFFYGSKIKSILSGRGRPPLQNENQRAPKKSASLVGKIKEEEHAEETREDLIASDQLNVANSSSRENDLMLGTVADVLKELKNLIQEIIDSKITKEQSIDLFKALLSNYNQIKATNYQRSIDLFIHENAVDQFDFELGLDEITQLW